MDDKGTTTLKGVTPQTGLDTDHDKTVAYAVELIASTRDFLNAVLLLKGSVGDRMRESGLIQALEIARTTMYELGKAFGSSYDDQDEQVLLALRGTMQQLVDRMNNARVKIHLATGCTGDECLVCRAARERSN